MIKNPGQKSVLGAETKKVFEPFTLVRSLICVSSIDDADLPKHVLSYTVGTKSSGCGFSSLH